MSAKEYDVVLVRKLFPKMTSKRKKEIIEIERDARETLKSYSRNQTFLINIPPKLRGKMREPESMTIRKRNRNYLVPHPKMAEPNIIFRGRGRSRRVLRDLEE